MEETPSGSGSSSRVSVINEKASKELTYSYFIPCQGFFSAPLTDSPSSETNKKCRTHKPSHTTAQKLSQRRARGVLNWATSCSFPDVMNPPFPLPPAHHESQHLSALTFLYWISWTIPWNNTLVPCPSHDRIIDIYKAKYLSFWNTNKLQQSNR